MTTIQEMIDGTEIEEMTSNAAAGIAGKNWTASIKLARQLASVYKGIKGSLGKSEMSDKHKKENRAMLRGRTEVPQARGCHLQRLFIGVG